MKKAAALYLKLKIPADEREDSKEVSAN